MSKTLGRARARLGRHTSLSQPTREGEGPKGPCPFPPSQVQGCACSSLAPERTDLVPLPAPMILLIFDPIWCKMPYKSGPTTAHTGAKPLPSARCLLGLAKLSGAAGELAQGPGEVGGT